MSRHPGAARAGALAAPGRVWNALGMANETVRVLRNTFYASVGFGVLAFQKVQVRRRELEGVLRPPIEAAVDHLKAAAGQSPD